MVDMTQLQAIYGGTFDPVHYGHLKPVEILANQIGLSKVIIMPTTFRRTGRSRKPPAPSACTC